MADRTDADLVRWIVEDPPGWKFDQQRWSAVGCVFGYGSTSASLLCSRFGFEPDQTRREFRAAGGRGSQEAERRSGGERSVSYETRAVLAGAYLPGNRRSTLTHAVEVDDEGRVLRVMCRVVKLESLADRCAHDPGATPTCERCAKRTKKEPTCP